MKKFIHIILPILVGIHLILGIWWLAVGWTIGWGLVWLATSSAKAVVRFRKMTFLIYPLIMIGVLLAAITFKTLFFGIYVIPSGSMEKTIVPGDMVWVNSLSYGPRLPYSPYEISWINVLVWFWEGKDTDVTKPWWNYKRFKGYSAPQRGDISVFNHPQNNIIFIKRIVALPGDTLQIIDGQLVNNGLQQAKPKNAVYYSEATFNNRAEGYALLDSLNISMFYNNSMRETVKFNGNLTPSEIEILRKHPQVLKAGIDPLRADTAWTVFPGKEELNWSIDNYGPYILPYSGMAIEKNAHNLSLYGSLMDQEVADNVKSKSDDSTVFVFKNDYYFLMGDNFHNSEDSRYFGPLKEEHIIGKASFVFFSQSNKQKGRFMFFSLL
jgi:signal peptidase I